MNKSPHREAYLSQFDNLNKIVETTNLKMISEPSDLFITENANFFSKSFLVLMCAYLESYLKDVLMLVIDEVNCRLEASKLPHNLIRWSFNLDKEFKDNEFRYENLRVSIKRKELDEFISGNPYKTRDLFRKFGINLDTNPIYNSQKENINLIIVKRNKILHHNDDASDLSNTDIVGYIADIKNYLVNIDGVICKHIE